MIVIAYNGAEVPEYIQTKMVEQLVINGLCERTSLKLIQYDDSAIADAIVANAATVSSVQISHPMDGEELNLLKNSAEYIYGKYLMGNSATPKSIMCAKMCKDVMDGDQKLRTAIQSITEISNRRGMPDSFRIRYGLSKEVENIIVNAYNVLQ